MCRGTADSILDEYLNKIGGVQALYKASEKATKGKKRSRPSTSGTPSSTKKSRVNGGAAVDSDASESRKPAAWKPPAGSWEDHIDQVDMTRDVSGDLIVWLTWKNGEKSQHKAQQAYTRAPQKVQSQQPTPRHLGVRYCAHTSSLVIIAAWTHLANIVWFSLDRCSSSTSQRSTLPTHHRSKIGTNKLEKMD